MGERILLVTFFMVTKHFFKTLLLFITMIALGLVAIYIVGNFEACKFDISCYINQVLP